MTEHTLTYRGVKVPAHIVDSVYENQAFADWSCGVDGALDNGPVVEVVDQTPKVGDRVRVVESEPRSSADISGNYYDGKVGLLTCVDTSGQDEYPYGVDFDGDCFEYVHSVEVVPK